MYYLPHPQKYIFLKIFQKNVKTFAEKIDFFRIVYFAKNFIKNLQEIDVFRIIFFRFPRIRGYSKLHVLRDFRDSNLRPLFSGYANLLFGPYSMRNYCKLTLGIL